MPRAATDTLAGLMPTTRLGRLVTILADHYRVIGPVSTGAEVRFTTIASGEDLQTQYTNTVLSPVRLFRRPIEAYLGVSWPPPQTGSVSRPPERLAVIGMRPCDLAALNILDRTVGRASGGRPSASVPAYVARRQGSFIAVFNCPIPCEAGFCASMGTGPGATEGYDLALTETEDGYVVQAGTPAGRDVMHQLQIEPATADDLTAREYVLERTAFQLRERLDLADLPSILDSESNHPFWQQLESRCIDCGTCTMACPTYLGDSAQTEGLEPPARNHVSRIKQRLYEKLDRFAQAHGLPACVGCGRCVRWCPAGIDVTEVVAALRMEHDI